MPAPRQAASIITSLAMVVAGLGVAAGLQLATAASGTVTGTVYEDYDADGTIGAREPGVVGVEVVAIDADGNRTLPVRTGTDGTYEIDLGTAVGDDLGAGPYRVEFSGWPSHLEQTTVGPDNGSSVQFVAADATNVSLGLAAPSDYCHDNPDIAASCFVYAGLPDAANWAAVVSVGWDTTDNDSRNNPNGPTDWMRDGDGNPTGETVLATIGEVGSVWGEAWDREAGVIYVGAFVKRHTALGPTGNPTTIYRIDTNGTPADPSDDVVGPWVTVDPGAPDPHSGASDGWHADYEAFDAVYQTGLGDVELSRDGSTVYTIDLRNRSLVAIPVNPDGSAGTPTTTPISSAMGVPNGYTAAEGSCAHADLQPAGLGVDADGRVHVGVVCTAAGTIDPADYGVDQNASRINGWNDSNVDMVPGDPYSLHGYVVEWDGVAGGSFTPVVDFRLDGPRGCIAFGGNCRFGGDSEWRPWVEHYPYNGFRDSYPQPVVTDIDFDNDAMLIALGDRWGHQAGPETRMRRPDGSTLRYRHPVTGGDLLRACGNGDGTFAIEGTGGCPQNTSIDGASEFFVDDRYRTTHRETGLGSVALAPGFDQFIHTQMDPVNAHQTWRSGGFAWTDPDLGTKDKGVRIYDGRDYTPSGTFEKASGVGDVELLCESAPLTIGNRVWLDLDGDGLQGADEPGIDGVTVTLLDAGDSVVTSTTTGTDPTGATGTWSFAIEPGMAYAVTFDASTATDLPLGITVDQLQLATQHAGDVRLDSDADVSGRIDVAPRAAGEHDHTLDVGFVPVPAQPGLDIEKHIAEANGTGAMIDADQTGPDAGVAWYLESGTFAYEITVVNTGEVDLVDVLVTDPVAPACATTITALAVGETSTWTCQLAVTAGTSSLVNTATATASWTPPYGPGMGSPQPVTDSDDAVARIVTPAITITKSTATGTPYAPGDTVTYTYLVEATGDIDLDLGATPRLSDDTCDTIVGIGSPTNVGDLDGDGVLDVAADLAAVDDGAREAWQFSCTTTVDLADLDTATTITNVVSVVGTPVAGDGTPVGLPDVTDTDDETITVYDPAIQLETQVWDPVAGVWRNADSLDGETGDDAVAVAHHTTTTAEYRYVVTNTGNTPLASVQITDSGAHLTGCTLPADVPGIVAPGDTVTVYGSGECLTGSLETAGALLTNTGRVQGNPVDADGADIVLFADVSDQDPASIHVIEAAIGVAKVPALQTLAPGGDAAWAFEVTNESVGIDELANITIDDVSTIGLDCDPQFDGGDTDADGLLDTSETWAYSCSVADVTESGADTVTVTGDVPPGVAIPEGAVPHTVSATDDAAHQVGELQLTKRVRIADTGANDGSAGGPGDWSHHVTVRTGETVDFQVVVANGSDVPLVNVVVADDQCTLALHEIVGDQSGSADEADQLLVLSVGESWEYRCASSTPDVETITNLASASGAVVADATLPEATMTAGDDAPDVDASASFETVEPRLSTHLFFPGAAGELDADGDAGTVGTNDPTPAVYAAGDTATLTIVVENTGTATLHDVVLTHDLGDGCVLDQGTLTTMAPGDRAVFQCEIVVGDAGAMHTATARADRSTAGGHEIGAVTTDVDDADTAAHRIAAVSLEKYVVDGDDLHDADTQLDAVDVLEGSAATWRIVVSNDGEVELLDLQIVDTIDLDDTPGPDCTFDPIASLAVGESTSVDCTVGSLTVDVENTASVTADVDDPLTGDTRELSDADPAFVTLVPLAELGDLVWHDLDGDGVQDAGEPGLPGITVELLDSAGATVATTTTDTDGRYLFADLVPGHYQVRVVVPAGWVTSPADQGIDDNLDSDVSADGLSGQTTLDPGEADVSLDAGLYQPVALGDLVWHDLDGDGVQDEGEPGVGGISVTVVDGEGTLVASTETSDDGRYLVEALPPGTYRVEFGLPDGWMRSPEDAEGVDDDVDSDADAAGVTHEVTLVSGERDMTLDAGIFEPASIGNLVWLDQDGDGFQDENEAGLADVGVQLLDEAGEIVATTVTDHAGRYLFDGLTPGNYAIRIVVPATMEPTDPDLAPGDVADSDIDESGQTPVTQLAPGEVDQTWDAGLVIPTVVLSTPSTSSATPTLAFTGATVTGLIAAGLLLLGLGGTARILADRVRRTPEAI